MILLNNLISKLLTLTILMLFLASCDSSTIINVDQNSTSVSINFPCEPDIRNRDVMDHKKLVKTSFYQCVNSGRTYLFVYSNYPKNSFNEDNKFEILESKANIIANKGYPNKVLSKKKTEILGHDAFIIRKRLFNPSSIIESRIFILEDGLFQVMYGAQKKLFSSVAAKQYLASVKISEKR